MSPRRPRIGIAPCFFHADPTRPIFKGKTLLYLEESLARWLAGAGAVPLLLPAACAALSAEALLADMDGLVLQGGSDVAPASYGELALRPEWEGDRVRDVLEIRLVEAALARGTPVLGVCRGLQLLNVALGGSLWQDIATQHPARRVHRDWAVYDGLVHEVCFTPGSWLASLYPGRAGGRVNSVHHQGVRDLAPSLSAEAVSVPDGLVEAVRYGAGGNDAGAPFVAAVQWHPEFQDPDDAGLLPAAPLLEDFLNAVRARC